MINYSQLKVLAASGEDAVGAPIDSVSHYVYIGGKRYVKDDVAKLIDAVPVLVDELLEKQRD